MKIDHFDGIPWLSCKLGQSSKPVSNLLGKRRKWMRREMKKETLYQGTPFVNLLHSIVDFRNG